MDRKCVRATTFGSLSLGRRRYENYSLPEPSERAQAYERSPTVWILPLEFGKEASVLDCDWLQAAVMRSETRAGQPLCAALKERHRDLLKCLKKNVWIL